MSGNANRHGSGSVWPKLVLSFVIFALMLAVGEVVLRKTAEEEPSIVFQSLATELDKVHLNTFKDILVKDPDLFWRLGPNQSLPDDSPHIRGLISNGAGLREDHEIPLKKPPGEIRILFVGDSCTFGFGTLNAESFVDMTERLLRERHPARKIECINAGVPGYTLMQGWQQLIHRGFRYHPDLIVVSFGWNDSRPWTSRSDWQHLKAKQKAAPPGVLAHSELCRQLWHRMHWSEAPPLPPGTHVPRVTVEEYEEILQSMHLLAQAHGAEFLPMVWPIMANFTHKEPDGSVPLTEYQKIVYRLGQKDFKFGPRQEPGVIDLVTDIQPALQQHGLEAFFIDGVHTRTLANYFIAQAIVNKIAPWYDMAAGK